MPTKLLINGELVEGADDKLTVLDPATGEEIVAQVGPRSVTSMILHG